MNATKEKILNKSLELYNAHGLPNVSQRNIAEALNMSHGNLTYHFKKKPQITEHLFRRFVNDLEHVGVTHRSQDNPLQDCIVLFENTYDLFYKYRFLLFDFMYLLKTNSALSHAFSQLWTQERYRIVKNIKDLVEKNISREEQIENEYDKYLHMNLLCFSQAFISCTQGLYGNAQAKDDYVKHMMVYLFPYLTTKGLKYFHQLGLQL